MAMRDQVGLGDELFGTRLGELCDAAGPVKGEFVLGLVETASFTRGRYLIGTQS